MQAIALHLGSKVLQNGFNTGELPSGQTRAVQRFDLAARAVKERQRAFGPANVTRKYHLFKKFSNLSNQLFR
jgi:hypothetical protein